MRNQKKSLGKGLASILGNNILRENKNKQSNIKLFTTEIQLSQIQKNPFQPRKKFNQEKINELAVSIEQLGVIQPITVRKINNHQYQLISGERRLRATQLLGIDKIPAYIRTANDKEMLEMALVENIQRENLNPIEIALSYKRLIDEIKLTQEECSERVGKKRSTVANFLRLLKLPNEIQKGIKEGLISNGHARALISIKNENNKINLYHDIVAHGYSVREVEQIAKEFTTRNYIRISKEREIIIPQNLSFNQQKLLHDISKKLTNNINIKKNKKGAGQMVIKFKNDEELNNILSSISNIK